MRSLLIAGTDVAELLGLMNKLSECWSVKENMQHDDPRWICWARQYILAYRQWTCYGRCGKAEATRYRLPSAWGRCWQDFGRDSRKYHWEAEGGRWYPGAFLQSYGSSAQRRWYCLPVLRRSDHIRWNHHSGCRRCEWDRCDSGWFATSCAQQKASRRRWDRFYGEWGAVGTGRQAFGLQSHICQERVLFRFSRSSGTDHPCSTV